MERDRSHKKNRILMEWWIEGGVLYTWMDGGRIQSRAIATGVVDADWNGAIGSWLIVRGNGLVESLSSRAFVERTFSRKGKRARWMGDHVQVQESDGYTRQYDSRGFEIRAFRA